MSDSVKNELENYYINYGAKSRVPCKMSENGRFSDMIAKGETLPNGVRRELVLLEGKTPKFYRIKDDLTPNEITDYILFTQLDTLNSIKRYLIFFVVLTCLGLVGYLASLLSII